MELVKNTPGIIPTFNGGLGNQYFQLVAAYLAAKYSKSPLFLPAETNNSNPHCKDKNKYLNTVFKDIGVHLPVPTSGEFYNTILKPLGYTFHELTVRMGYKPYDPKKYSQEQSCILTFNMLRQSKNMKKRYEISY